MQSGIDATVQNSDGTHPPRRTNRVLCPLTEADDDKKMQAQYTIDHPSTRVAVFMGGSDYLDKWLLFPPVLYQ